MPFWTIRVSRVVKYCGQSERSKNYIVFVKRPLLSTKGDLLKKTLTLRRSRFQKSVTLRVCVLIFSRGTWEYCVISSSEFMIDGRAFKFRQRVLLQGEFVKCFSLIFFKEGPMTKRIAA